jgi:hypothetical protein
MFDVYGSKHSLLPRIWLVLAVGMGATSSELRTPFCRRGQGVGETKAGGGARC